MNIGYVCECKPYSGLSAIGRALATRATRAITGSAFGVGGLAHLLRNRCYIGEVVYGGETFRGDHEPGPY